MDKGFSVVWDRVRWRKRDEGTGSRVEGTGKKGVLIEHSTNSWEPVRFPTNRSRPH
uniref:Uncharacterized protein n=1 Tax=Nelumbo nucifera TaxID=4432 RepID=A0A822YPZ9_NELNU|nr:TPA_asm: hypothetical protein HUJ06_012270 [Nelumbo nucifera]